MAKKKAKVEARKINVEIAPAVQRELDAHIQTYNGRPERSTPKLKYTDVVNEALAQFLQGELGVAEKTETEGGKRGKGKRQKEERRSENVGQR